MSVMISKSNPVQQLKYFVSCADTLVGQSIVEQVRNDHMNDINPHIIIGTKSSKNIGPVPKPVKKIINSADPAVLTKTLIDSDVIIYDLNSAKLDEVEYAIKVLKMANFDTEKTLILISSVMVWSNTPPREKKDGDEEDLSIIPEEGEETSLNAGTNALATLAYREKDYARRRPSPKYEVFKTLETQCLNAGNIKKNLTTYVLCSGILYGHGEETFAEYFKQAWLQNPEGLSYIGEGRNIIPTIHVKDLAMFVHFVVLKRPMTRYIFAIDHARNQTLKNIVQTISGGLGTGTVKPISILDAMNDPYLEVFKLNIKLQPSNVVEITEGEEQGLEEIDEKDEEVEALTTPRFKFTWWCKEGLKKNLDKVVNEYNTYRELKPLKVFLAGPPAGGKTFFGTKLSKQYKVPHIHVADAVKEVQELQTEFGNEIRTLLAEMKAKMIEEAEAQAEELRKKKKKGQPDPVVDPDKLIPRLPDNLLLKVFQYMLEKNECRNKGYILDGFPRTYEQAKALFTLHAPPKEGEAAEGEGEPIPQPELDKSKAPEFVIKIEAADEFLKARVKGLPEDQIAGTHYTEEGMTRRLGVYAKHNTADGVNPVLVSFFEEHNIEVLKIKYDNVTNEQIEESIKQHLDKGGPFKTFQDEELLEELKTKRKLREEQEQEARKQEELRKQQEEKERREKQLSEEEARKKLEKIKENEKTLLDERSQPLRQYLADMVVPTLTTGLIEICKERPEDPLEFLIDYLTKKSPDLFKQPEVPVASMK